MKVGVQRLSLICPQEEITNQLDAASDKKARQDWKTEEPIQTFENNLPMDNPISSYPSPISLYGPPIYENNSKEIGKEEYIEELADEISEDEGMYCQDVEKISKYKVMVKVDNEGDDVIRDFKK